MPGGDDGSGSETGGEGYDSRAEAQKAAKTVSDLLGDARSEIRQMEAQHQAEIEHTAGLAQAVGHLTDAVEALNRTIAALRADLAAGRGGGQLTAVAVIQNQTAGGAVAEAVSASDGTVKKLLQAILRKLSRATEWLWSMITWRRSSSGRSAAK